jgi:hypothetical protein
MPAVSTAQQQAMGIAHAHRKYGKPLKKGTPSADIEKSMKSKDLRKYAKTKHAGLPKHVPKKEEKLREFIRNEIHGAFAEAKSSRFAVQCMECGKRFKTAKMDPKCPKCGGYDIDLDYGPKFGPKKEETTMQDPHAGKGELRHSRKVRTAHDSTTSSDVDNFDRGGYPGERHLEAEATNPVALIADYANLGECLRKVGSFREMAENIGRISELAESTVMEEAGDWFDQHTIKRNMKELKSHAKAFGKIAEEIDGMHQRATALYDDMGNVLSRYFEIAGPKGDDDDAFPGAAPEFTPGDPRAEKGREKWDKRDGVDDEENEDLSSFGSKKAPEFTPDDPRAEAGRKKWDMRDGEDDVEEEEFDPMNELMEAFISEDGDLSTAQLHQAIKTLRTPKAYTRVVNNMTRDQALGVVKKHGATNVREAKVAIYKEALREYIRQENARPFV